MRRICAAIIAMALLTLGSAGIGVGADLVATYTVGEEPFGITSDPTDGRVYVANSGLRTPLGTGHVSVIDPAASTVTSLDTTKPSALLALDSVARRLYSSNYDQTNDSVSLDVFDLNTGTRTNSFDLGGLGVALDTTRSRLYVAGGSYVAWIDTNTFEMDARSAPFPQFWVGVATDPALGHLYVTNASGAQPSLLVLDANDLHTLSNFSLPSAPRYALTVDLARHHVFVAGDDLAGPPYANSTVSVLDASTTPFTLRTATLPGSPGGMALDTAAHRVWVTDQFGHRAVAIDDTTLEVVDEFALDSEPALATLGRDGLLYVCGNSSANVKSYSVGHSNAAPTIESVNLRPLTPDTDDTLTATVVANDLDGDDLTYTFTWRVGEGDPVRTTTTTSATDSLDLSVAGNGDAGDVVDVSVVASDGDLTSAAASATAKVANIAPTAEVSLSDDRAKKQDVLTATVVASDGDGQPLTYSYAWHLNGALMQSSTGSSATSDFDLKAAGATIGDVVTVDVVVSDGTASATASAFAKITPAGH
jgi:DNA-binding beta-propeller fold protein YncE